VLHYNGFLVEKVSRSYDVFNYICSFATFHYTISLCGNLIAGAPDPCLLSAVAFSEYS